MNTLVQNILISYPTRTQYRNNTSASLHPMGCTGIWGIPTPSSTSSLKVYSAEIKCVKWKQLKTGARGIGNFFYDSCRFVIYLTLYSKLKVPPKSMIVLLIWSIKFNSNILNHLYSNLKSITGIVDSQTCFDSPHNSLKLYYSFYYYISFCPDWITQFVRGSSQYVKVVGLIPGQGTYKY